MRRIKFGRVTLENLLKASLVVIFQTGIKPKDLAFKKTKCFFGHFSRQNKRIFKHQPAKLNKVTKL